MSGPGTGLSRIALALLVVACVLLTGATVWGGMVYPGYDHARQFISELGATGTVTGQAVNRWGFVPNGLLYSVFCLIAAWLLRRSWLAVAGCLLLACNGIGMAGAGVYPCDFECSRSDPSPEALLHDLFGGVGYLCAIPGVALTALWARRTSAPWLAPLGVVVMIVSIAGLYAVVTEVELKGLFQRTMELALAVFMLALGWALARGLRGVPPNRP